MRIVEKIELTSFEWDDGKRARTLRDREINFADAALALLEPHLEEASDRQGEARTLALCNIKGEVVAVVYTVREPNCRIISARAARRYERRKYREILGG